MLKILCLFVFTSALHATTFKPQPVDQQIRESDGIFQGHYLKRKTVKLENGSLATQMVFKMTKEVGLQSDFFGMDEVIVHYPGGTLEGKTVQVEGVPRFVPGEKVVLFIRNVENRYWGMNLGFGSFKVINYGKEVMLVNYIFPKNPQVGQIKYGEFENTVKEIKGSSFKVVQSLQYPTAAPKTVVQRMPASERQNRSVASKSEGMDNSEEGRGFNVFWLVMIFGMVGGIFRLTTRKSFR